ncbi:MAG: hypothetical protein WCY25_10315 [Moheibacter sp.]
MNYLKIIVLFFSVCAAAQSKVFEPDEFSVKLNEAYTSNFFFGNFGIKHLVNAIPINYQSVKTMSVTTATETRKAQTILTFSFDADGKLLQMNLSELLSGEAVNVDYSYKNGVISEEIFTTGEGEKSNRFYYSAGKMTVETSKGMSDNYWLKDKILYKTSYLDGKLVFKDRIEGKCRITQYRQDDINKICFSNFNYQLPFSLEEFTSKEDVKSGKISLIKDKTIEVKKQSETLYSIFSNDKEVYELHLDEDHRLIEFKFLGNKSENEKPLSFHFSYTYYN